MFSEPKLKHFLKYGTYLYSKKMTSGGANTYARNIIERGRRHKLVSRSRRDFGKSSEILFGVPQLDEYKSRR